MTDLHPEPAVRTAGEDPAVVAHRIQVRLQAGDNNGAAEIAAAHIADAEFSPRLAQMCMLAFGRVDDRDRAAVLARHLVDERNLGADLSLQVSQFLLREGQAEDALAVAQRALSDGATSPRLHFVVAQALLTLGGSTEEALEHLEHARREAPDDLPLLRIYGELLLQAGRYDESVEVLARAAARAPNLANVQLLYARALKFARRYTEASEVMLKASQINPKSVQSKRMATGALLQAGRDEEAHALFADLISERRARLKGTFLEELAALEGRLHEARIPPSRFEWAWQVTSRALGHAPSDDRIDWEHRARWGSLADLVIIDWLECQPERAEGLIDLLDGIEPARDTLHTVLAEGRGALLASAHIGPMFAGPLALHLAGVPNKWLSSTPRISTTAYADALISTSDLTETQVARKVVEALHGGNMVTLAVDGAMSPKAPKIEWEGATITYSDFTAVVAFRMGVPSLFTTPYWRDGRIAFSVSHLPRPTEGESLHDFVARWRKAYFAEILAQFTRGPENLRMSGGIWRHV